MAYTLQPWQVFLAALAGWINRHQQAAIDFLREENRVFLEQLGDQRIRLTDDQRRRLAVAGKAVGRKALLDLAGIVTPDTILAWHRKLVAAKWDQRSKRGPGRPGVMKEIEKLVVRFATENPSWGYRQIEGAVANLGHHVARTTVANLLQRNGIDPAPERGSRMSWRTFLSAHWSTIAAIDVTTVEVWGSTRSRHDVRPVRDRATRPARSLCRHDARSRRRLDSSSRAEPHRSDRWVLVREAILSDGS